MKLGERRARHAHRGKDQSSAPRWSNRRSRSTIAALFGLQERASIVDAPASVVIYLPPSSFAIFLQGVIVLS